MNDQDLNKIALRIANDRLESMDFSFVYEDEECEDLDQDDLERIYNLITLYAKVSIE